MTCEDGEDKENTCLEPVLPEGMEPNKEIEESKVEVEKDSMSDVMGDDNDVDEIFSDGSGINRLPLYLVTQSSQNKQPSAAKQNLNE